MKIKHENYQGYANRSTWLAKLHLDNTNKEITDRAIEFAIQADTTKSFKSMITPLLLDCKQLWKEQDFDSLRIDFSELWDCFRK